MNKEPNPSENPNPLDDPICEHTYDGIAEYDRRLPNWWLWTLYLAMIFGAGYWFYYQFPSEHETSLQRVTRTMNEIALTSAKSSGAELTDEQLWALSKDPAAVQAGALTFQTTCASCHMPDLAGKIGPNLRDNTWVHGGKPTEIVHTIIAGVPAKGMPTWGPILGPTRINELTAYILSYHKPSDPIVKVETK